MKKNIYVKWAAALAVCLAFSVLLCANIVAIENQKTYHWYVKRNTEHLQPQIDVEQQMVEKYNGYYVDKRCKENAEDKVIYLTFDAGYENGNIARILDTLKNENVPAAFFVLKNIITREAPLLERMVNDGHFVCNHTMTHKDTTEMDEAEFYAELNGLADLYKEETGSDMPKYYRPPEGKYNERTLQYASKLGYKTIFWSFAYADWDNDKQPDPAKAKETVMKNTHNGAVILLHPTSKTNADILPELIREWKAQGYRFGTLNELTNS